MSDYKPFVPAGTLAGKVILITGASQGIGLVAAHGFHWQARRSRLAPGVASLWSRQRPPSAGRVAKRSA